MDIHEALKRLDALQRKQIAYNHALGLLSFDGDTGAPRGTADNRGETLAILSGEQYALTTSEEAIRLVDDLHAIRQELDDVNRRVVEEMHRDIEDMRKIPKDEYIAYQKLSNQANAVWHTAKETDDYPLFMPYLERMIAANVRLMGYVKPGVPAYDALLDRFERGLTRARCDAFFDVLRGELVPFIRRITQAPQVDDAPLRGRFPLEQQRLLSDYLMDVLCVDREHCGIAQAEHPFTASFTKHDVRVTTHYYEDNFASSMYSVIHECGHALYDLNPDDKYAYTILGGGVSMGVHESQSRLYENIIGRSRAFIGLVFPTLRQLFPALAAYDELAVYRAINRVSPSLIRTEADELTYCLHIMVRYEIEQQLFDGVLNVRDLPDRWNALYQRYLGVSVPNNREGVLQDTHWANGLFGYFPSYALGSAYGAQMVSVMRQTLDVEDCIARGDMRPIHDWLRESVWRHGGLYPPQELLARALGAPFDPMHYVRYLKAKFSDVYGLA